MMGIASTAVRKILRLYPFGEGSIIFDDYRQFTKVANAVSPYRLVYGIARDFIDALLVFLQPGRFNACEVTEGHPSHGDAREVVAKKNVH